MKLPIRIRLTAAFALTLAVVLAVVGVFVFARFRDEADRTIDVELHNRTTAFFAVRSPGPQLRTDLLGLADEHFGQVLDRRGRVATASAQVARHPLASRSLTGFRTATVRTNDEFRHVRLLVTHRNGATLVLASALDDRDDALGHLASLLWLGGGLTFVVASGLAWFLAGAALRPVERLRGEAATYSASDLTRRLAVPPGNDELHRLAGTLNGMLDRIQESFERQRSFVDNASHELRTPLTNLSLELELALRRDRTTTRLRQALESARVEVARLDRLASNLLLLARTTDGGLAIARESTDLAALLRDVTSSFGARSEQAGIALLVDALSTDPIAVDPVRVRQAVSNLVDNALRVTPRGGTVTVRASDLDGVATVEVVDTGPGFPPELRDTAFGLFVRGPVGARSADGAGLGLAIVAAVAEAHGGQTTIAAPVAGARVSITLLHGPVAL